MGQSRLTSVRRQPAAAWADVISTPNTFENLSIFEAGRKLRFSPHVYPLPMPDMKPDKSSPQRVHRHAYIRLSKLCAEIQRGRYPNKADLASIVNRTTRTVQKDIQALKDGEQLRDFL